ncbi:hypothetical protein [Azospirillum sp. B506]|uniref:hypothetical protein n=1 Tax=Azospirillum sp. B506 TaxID=137721 RepID=UPI0005B2B627|nr:hypothetical protein [Azospirillum sp. B506]
MHIPKISTLRRETLWRDKQGVTVSAMAEGWGVADSTLRALLDHHGFLETVPYGGQQRRALVPDNVFYAGYGHNVIPGKGSGVFQGDKSTIIFPVFYEEVLDNIWWCLDYAGITKEISKIDNKKWRLNHLLSDHGYLPNTEVALLSGYTVNGVSVARLRRQGEQREMLAA